MLIDFISEYVYLANMRNNWLRSTWLEYLSKKSHSTEWTLQVMFAINRLWINARCKPL